ncbi:MAG: TadE family protein [Myxococcota bacterium]
MRRRDRDRDRRGGVLVEFALVAFAVWLVLAGVLELGRAFSAQQILQHAARTIARELSQVELAHDASFDEALRRVVDSRFLVIDSGLLARCGIPDFGAEGHSTGLERLFAETLPIGNRLLRPLMIRDREGNLELLRYPGALLVRTDGGVSATSGCEAGSIYTVGIPQLDDAAGSVQWRPVVEESPGPNAGPAQREGFELARGAWAGIRLNYPFQSAALLAARQDGGVDPETGLATRALVDADASYTDQGLEQLGASLISTDPTGSTALSTYAGPRGLGRVYSLPDASGAGRAVRPYRRLLSASAGFRREILLPATGGSAS